MKLLVGMSGGVDSSVAAYLMRAAGQECVGCSISFHKDRGGEADLADARAVCEKIGIELAVLDMSDEFEREVVERFIDSYESGLTPNPCYICNRFAKFEGLIRMADELSCDKVVTGHYARVEYEGGRYVIKRALDESKDQSYMLASLTQGQLSRLVLPLGDYTKSEIREIAEREGLVNSKKRDSQDICFIPDGDYVAFIEKKTGRAHESGDILDKNGAVIGTHRGSLGYTIGQRKGLGVSSKTPLYVTRIDTEKNTVTLGEESELYSREFYIKDFNPVAVSAISERIAAEVKVRYRQRAARCVVEPLPDGRLFVVFDEPVRAITAGQSAVLYSGDTVLGGGEVEL